MIIKLPYMQLCQFIFTYRPNNNVPADREDSLCSKVFSWERFLRKINMYLIYTVSKMNPYGIESQDNESK